MPFKLTRVFHFGQPDVGSAAGKGKGLCGSLGGKMLFCLLLNQCTALHSPCVRREDSIFISNAGIGNISANPALCPVLPTTEAATGSPSISGSFPPDLLQPG